MRGLVIRAPDLQRQSAVKRIEQIEMKRPTQMHGYHLMVQEFWAETRSRLTSGRTSLEQRMAVTGAAMTRWRNADEATKKQ